MNSKQVVIVFFGLVSSTGAQAGGDRQSPAPEVYRTPIFVGAAVSQSLIDAPPYQGVFVSPFGANIAFCSVNGCFPGRHLAAEMLVNMDTKIDATSQEIGLFVNATSRSGRAESWRPLTFYQKGTQVQSGNGALYEAVSSGLSGRGPQPSTRGSSIHDGEVTWSFKSEFVHNGKTALGAGLNMVEGSGAGWALVSDLTVRKGVGDQDAFGYENDCSNFNKDSDFGVHFLMTCLFQGGQGNGTFPMFSYRYVSAADGSKYGAHYGDFFNGAVTIKDATIFDATNAIHTLQVVAGSKHDSVYFDQSSSNHSIELSGNYRSAIDLSKATVNEAQIKGRAWQVGPQGTISAAGFRTALSAPGSSSDPCQAGEIRVGENFIYICVQTNRWRRATLSSW